MEAGYRAFVQVYDEEFYVDTNTGEGFDKVLKKIDPLLNKFASTMYIPGYKFEDAKNEIAIIAIEGIKSFDPHREIKLSTFLHKHIHNKKISFIKSENKLSNDAFSLQAKDPEVLDPKAPKIKKIREELHFSQFKASNQKDDQQMLFENTLPEDNSSFDSSIIKTKFEKSEFESSLIRACAKLDEKTKKIIELMYFEDYSIKDAADAVGLSGWAASMRLKKLAGRGHIRNIFGVDGETSDSKDYEVDDDMGFVNVGGNAR